MLPALVVHADWGTDAKKRWMARAELREGVYVAQAPEPVGAASTLLSRVAAQRPEGCVVVGFDFPIGLPRRYAELAGITDFRTLLPRLGAGEWAPFYSVAERPDEVSVRRPFYPQRPGNARQEHLLGGLGAVTLDDLRRRCDLAHAGRRAASPIFWTLGGQQVGKAAISGWRDVIAPALGAGETTVALWPFDGPFADLLSPGRVVVVETYPAEYYRPLGVTFPFASAGQVSGKRVQRDRQANAAALLAWATTSGVRLSPHLREQALDGFGSSASGEDAFDAVIGLFGMLSVVLGQRPEGTPDDPVVRTVEGWIIGQQPDGEPPERVGNRRAPVAVRAPAAATPRGQIVEGRVELLGAPAHSVFRATNSRGNAILLGSAPTDEAAAKDWTGVSPMEVVLLGLGGCTGLDVISTLHKMRQDVTGYAVRVSGERRDEHPRIYTRIEVEHELRGRALKEDSVRRAITLSAAKYCSVSAMLEVNAELILTYRIVEDTTGAHTNGSIPRAHIEAATESE